MVTDVEKKLRRLVDMALCLARKWWRPAACIALVLSFFVNFVYIPYLTQTPINPVDWAAAVAALTAAFAVREWGKFKGVSNNDD